MADTLYDADAIKQALDSMSQAMQASEVFVVGILRGGAAVADALQSRLETAGCEVQRGNLDISFYRDDLDTIGPNPEVHPSHLPFDMNGQHLWLVDDVLYTGRTVRAAMGEIFDYGRPSSVRLACLLDRGGRELPIAANVIGLYHEAPHGVSVKLIYEENSEDWSIVQRRVET